VEAVRKWSKERGFKCNFRAGDVTDLPYEAESLSGYLSFGVLEHFEKDPEKVLAEAHRVLRPGGVALISTPSMSFAQAYFHLRRYAKNTVKRLIGRQLRPEPFFQHWYSLSQLSSFVDSCGLKLVLSGVCDLKYAFFELGKSSTRWFRVADFLERTPLVRWGAQAFAVAVKIADKMHCFLCGQKNIPFEKWHKHYLPICGGCSSSPLAIHYLRKKRPHFHSRWEYNPLFLSDSSSNRECHFCGQIVEPDLLFENFGFSIPICSQCLQIPALNLVASNEHLQPRWRPRTILPKVS
jgi:SAM-dependent methyltransferase